MRNFQEKLILSNIFIRKFKGIKINSSSLKNEDLTKIKIHENIILEDLDENIDEKLLYSLFNIVDLDNKYIIVTSSVPIVNIEFFIN